jgi:DNA-directed RNA polymerase specialized sigma24 family protein
MLRLSRALLPASDAAIRAQRVHSRGSPLTPRCGDALSPFGRQALASTMDHPPERERYVMSMADKHAMNLKEIAAVLGVTESRVCQQHSQSIPRLRSKLREW